MVGWDGSAPLVFCGAATHDAVALVGAVPPRDGRGEARSLCHAGGGPAATAAVTAARLGAPAAFVGTVGDDEEGERIREGLGAEGVDVSATTRRPDVASGASLVLVEDDHGTRTIVSRPAPDPVIDPGSAADSLLAAAPWVHVDHVGWSAYAGWGRRVAVGHREAASRPRLSVDGGNDVPGLDLTTVDLYVPTVDALRRTYGDLPEPRLLEAALHEGAKAVVATRGSRGSCMARADGEWAEAPGHVVQPVSTLGAGDVFHGALLAALARGSSLRGALPYANTVAALSCRALDGRSAIPTHDEACAVLAAGSPPADVPAM